MLLWEPCALLTASQLCLGLQALLFLNRHPRETTFPGSPFPGDPQSSPSARLEALMAADLPGDRRPRLCPCRGQGEAQPSFLGQQCLQKSKSMIGPSTMLASFYSRGQGIQPPKQGSQPSLTLSEAHIGQQAVLMLEARARIPFNNLL